MFKNLLHALIFGLVVSIQQGSIEAVVEPIESRKCKLVELLQCWVRPDEFQMF